MPTVVGRFAPTPSGPLHLGNLLCAMLAWLSVRSQGGRFLLRIEDLDVPRCPPSAGKELISALRFFGFDWDEPVIWQHERTSAYLEVLSQLKHMGLVYPCFCTRASLHNEAAPNLGDTQYVYPGTCAHLSEEQRSQLFMIRNPAWRMKVPDRSLSFHDCIYGDISENPKRDCGDFIVQRSDGIFGYQLAVVVDDASTGVNEVVRGRDILSSTPRQICLMDALSFEHPRWYHIPLLLDPLGRRLSKRDKDIGLKAISQRFRTDEILGHLAYACGLLPEARPMTIHQLLPYFDWSRISREDIRIPAALM